MSDIIHIVGARTHNLKDVTCDVPRGKLIVVTGVSGSGKSTLAFDTLYAEGQRRYVESMSAYARQFLERLARPDVDRVENVPPAIALEQHNHVTGARSTVGTATEINDYLRLVFTHVGRTTCPECGAAVTADSASSVSRELDRDHAGELALIMAPLAEGTVETKPPTRRELMREGFRRVWACGEVHRLDEIDDDAYSALADPHLVVDRVTPTPDDPEATSRLTEALASAFRLGHGHVAVKLDEEPILRYSNLFSCNRCGTMFRHPEHQLFSFNSPLGACPRCEGFGRVIGVDMTKVLPDPSQSIDEKPFAIWNYPSFQECYQDLYRACETWDIATDVPFGQLPKRDQEIVLRGRDDWYGVDGFFQWLEGRRYKVHVRVMLARFRSYEVCPECHGARLKPEALAVTINGRNIAEVCEMSIVEAIGFFERAELTDEQRERAGHLVDEVLSRLRYLRDIGLSYLTLSRQTRTLSGGEALRINLATALGSSLTETLYVLDEPTVGLHARDTDRLLAILKALRDKGNTIVVVEHDPLIIEGADEVIDMGPGAGEHGGEIIFQGPFDKLVKSRRSLTGEHLRALRKRKRPDKRRAPEGFITVEGARARNLKNVTVKIPTGVLCCVTGVSGSGKSTLVDHTLHAGYRRLKGDHLAEAGACDRIIGINRVHDLVLIDQAPIGQSSRSNPVTYVKAWDEIRSLMAATSQARISGIRPGHFSFNVKGGRCEKCAGVGEVSVDMHFLADVTMVCDACGGKRFKRDVLEVKYKGKNIDDILNMTVTEAIMFFRRESKIVNRLAQLEAIGLGYLRLGQSTATLSGGEAQRLKLAGMLTGSGSGKRLMFIFDEPTTGLHMADIQVLLAVIERIVAEGHSVVVIEHNMELIKAADWVIDLGPDGGDRGGEIVVEGPPEEVAKCEASLTGKFLREVLPEGGKKKRKEKAEKPKRARKKKKESVEEKTDGQ